MAFKNTVKAIALTSFDSASLTSSYLPINSAGLPQACILVRIINDSSVDVTISYDGTADNDYLRTTETLQLPLQSNSQPNNNESVLPKGTKVYVKGTAGTGSLYLAGYYQPTIG